MSWNINLADVTTSLETIPAQDFTFSVVGAKYSDRDPNKIEVSALISTEGPFQGRKVFFSYPDPDKFGWSPKVFKRLEQAIGVDADAGEDPVEYLNRMSGQRFASQIQHRSYTPEGGSEVTKAELNIFNVKPAA